MKFALVMGTAFVLLTGGTLAFLLVMASYSIARAFGEAMQRWGRP